MAAGGCQTRAEGRAARSSCAGGLCLGTAWHVGGWLLPWRLPFGLSSPRAFPEELLSRSPHLRPAGLAVLRCSRRRGVSGGGVRTNVSESSVALKAYENVCPFAKLFHFLFS